VRHEVLTGVERRRRWSLEQKVRVLAEVEADSGSVAAVARRHGLHRQQVHQWRRDLRRKGLLPVERPVFLPVEVGEDAGSGTAAEARAEVDAAAADEAPVTEGGPRLEIGLRNGRCLRLAGDIPDAVVLRFIRLAEAS